MIFPYMYMCVYLIFLYENRKKKCTSLGSLQIYFRSLMTLIRC